MPLRSHCRRLSLAALLSAFALTAASCCPGSTAGTGSDSGAIDVIAQPSKIEVPPDPPPPFIDSREEGTANSVAELAESPEYQSAWDEGNGEELRLFLTGVSRLFQTMTNPPGSDVPDTLGDRLKAASLLDPASHLVSYHLHEGAFPEEFASKFTAYLDEIRDKPNRGLWSKGDDMLVSYKGASPEAWEPSEEVFDFSPLASWFNRDEPPYLREMMNAMRSGPYGWPAAGEEPWLRAYLSDEMAALERLNLLTTLGPEEEDRLAELAALAEKPLLLGAVEEDIKGLLENEFGEVWLAQSRSQQRQVFESPKYAVRVRFQDGQADWITFSASSWKVENGGGNTIEAGAVSDFLRASAGNDEVTWTEDSPSAACGSVQSRRGSITVYEERDGGSPLQVTVSSEPCD